MITSLRNPVVKFARSLRHKKYRRVHRAFLVEGIRLIKEAVDSGITLSMLFYSPAELKSIVAAHLIEDLKDAETQILVVSEAVMKSLSLKENPQGMIAVAPFLSADPAKLPVGNQSRFLWAHDVRDPGNLGTMIRSCDALGGTAFIITGNSADPFDPKAVRASMGSLFSIPVVYDLTPDEAIAFLRGNNVEIVATSPQSAESITDIRWRLPLCLLVGNEGEGLPDELIKLADKHVRIPMVGKADSLNVAVAASISMYEIFRQFPIV